MPNKNPKLFQTENVRKCNAKTCNNRVRKKAAYDFNYWLISDTIPTVLIWKKAFGDATEYLANPGTCNENIECDITYDRDVLQQADSVVFHFSDISMESMPKWR